MPYKDPKKRQKAKNDWYHKNKWYYQEYRHKYHLKKKYGLELDDYITLILEQNNQCAICKVYFDTSKGHDGPHVDHNHATGSIRKLLCKRCNIVLGFVRDDTDLLEKMIVYLKEHQ
jgi:Recombination endonuclease VII